MHVIDFPLADIIIPADRQRVKAEADLALISSIEKHGLIQPIILRDGNTLVAGERRLDAFRQLKRPTIPVRLWEDLSPLEAFEVELLENIARKQLSWQEEARAIYSYHQLRLASFAAWTQMGTAEALGLSSSQVSMKLAVAAQLGDDEVSGCATLQAAFNLLTARADRARMAAQSRGLDVAGITAGLTPLIPPGASREEKTAALLQSVKLSENVAETITDLDAKIAGLEEGRLAAAALEANRAREEVGDLVVNADFLEWVVDYSGPKFDVLHIDFPYGKGYKGSNTRQTGKATMNPLYADDPDIYYGLVDGLLQSQDNIAFPAAHCLLWFDMLYYSWTINIFEKNGWSLVQPYPLIWTKGYTGNAADTRRRPRHCYETALLFSRGDRKLSRLDNDHFACALEETKIHISQKPVLMLKKFLSLIVDEHTALLDPTCGSGSSLVAARQLKAARVLGVELDPSNAEIARYLIQNRSTEPST